MSVFYSYSNNREFSRELYEQISSDESLNIVDVENTNENESELTYKILNHVSDSVFMVCDITPDLILDCATGQSVKTNPTDPLKLVGLPNPNVMLELGYFMQGNLTSNIILLCDENITNKNSNLIPSMLRGYDITYYDSTDLDYSSYIIKEKIKLFTNNFDKQIEEQIGWTNFNYCFTEDFLKTIAGLVNIKIKTNWVRTNKNLRQAVIIFLGENSSKGKINIITKKLYLTNKEICLSKFKNIYEELKHIELLINLNFNN